VIFRQPNSLYMRFLLPLGGALLIAMAAAWAIALILLTNVMDDQLDAKLENAVATLADGVFPFTPDLIQRFDQLIEARVALLDGDGVVRLSTGDSSVTDALDGAGLAAADANGPEPTIVTIQANDLAWKVAIQSLPRGRDDRYRYVVAMASLTDSQAVAREAALLLAAAMFVAALVLALFGSIFIRSITRPITDLAAMANRIAEGQRDIVANINEDNEIGVLARSFDDMAARLDDYETELAQTSRLAGLGDLASRMAHEIRNPLTAMKMQLEMLEDRVSEANRQRVSSVLDEVRRLELVIDNSLALGGPNSLNPTPTDASRLIGDVADLLQPELAHRQIELACNIPALPTLALDSHRIKQVLLNLIKNAADELEHGGTIAISATAEADDRVDIHVEDTGPGLREADEGSTKPLGLGLGLKISQEIVERHGGELRRGRSETLGGAKFTIRLPASIMSVPAS